MSITRSNKRNVPANAASRSRSKVTLTIRMLPSSSVSLCEREVNRHQSKHAMPTVLDNDTDGTYREGYQRRVDMSATSVQSQFPSSHGVRILKGGRAVNECRGRHIIQGTYRTLVALDVESKIYSTTEPDVRLGTVGIVIRPTGADLIGSSRTTSRDGLIPSNVDPGTVRCETFEAAYQE